MENFSNEAQVLRVGAGPKLLTLVGGQLSFLRFSVFLYFFRMQVGATKYNLWNNRWGEQMVEGLSRARSAGGNRNL